MKSYVIGIIEKDNKYILFYHHKIKCYTTPGGKVEKNELPIFTLIRELKEEVNLNVKINDIIFLGKTNHFNRMQGHFKLYNYYIKWNNKFGELKNLEYDKHSNLEWYTIKQIQEIKEKSYSINMILELSNYI